MARFAKLSLLLCLGLSLRSQTARAAQVKSDKPTVKIGYASQSGAFAQLWIAAHPVSTRS